MQAEPRLSQQMAQVGSGSSTRRAALKPRPAIFHIGQHIAQDGLGCSVQPLDGLFFEETFQHR